MCYRAEEAAAHILDYVIQGVLAIECYTWIGQCFGKDTGGYGTIEANAIWLRNVDYQEWEA